MDQYQLTQEQVDALLVWIDSLPISRPKKNLTRDFSDGVPVAEILRHYFPKVIDMHNYPPANSVTQKLYNWKTLRQKAFRKINYSPSDEVLNAIAQCRPGFVELLLSDLRRKIEYQMQKKQQPQFAEPQLDSYHSSNTSRELFLPPLPHQNHHQHNSPYPYYPPTHHQPTHHEYPPSANLHSPVAHHPPAHLGHAIYHHPHANHSPAHHPRHSPVAVGHTPATGGHHTPASPNIKHKQVDQSRQTAELKETIKLLQLKVSKLEQLMEIKDRKIAELSSYQEQQQQN